MLPSATGITHALLMFAVSLAIRCLVLMIDIDLENPAKEITSGMTIHLAFIQSMEAAGDASNVNHSDGMPKNRGQKEGSNVKLMGALIIWQMQKK